jgi:hypothetical protein
MDIEPASIEQIRIGHDGRMVLISAQASQVVKDLQAIVPEIRVRFAEDAPEPFWAVYLQTEDADGRVNQHLVSTIKAHQTNSGTWAGLDDRIVRRIEEIDPHGRGGYDYAQELQKQNELAAKRSRERTRERLDVIGEVAEFELRRLLGTQKDRVFT